MNKQLAPLLATLLSLSLVSQAFAIGGAGIGNEVLSARSIGQGFVGVAAQNEDPATIYSNPAGLTLLKGSQIAVGETWENLHGKFVNDTGNESSMRSVDVSIPNFAATHSWMDGKLGAGLGLFSPFGLETHWADDSPLRYVATNSRLRLLILAPAIAFQVHPMVSVGAGADYVNTFDTALEKHINVDVVNFALGSPTAGSSDANFRLSGTGANWGYHAGIVFQPTDQHSIGLVYHSKIKLTVNGSISLTGLSGAAASLFGGTNYTSSAYTDLFVPQNVQLGYAYKPTEKWTVEADVAWFDWYSTRDLNVRFAETNPTRLAILTNNGQGNPTPENWRDTLNFAVGANYRCTKNLQVRSGFWNQPYTQPESTFSPAYNDLSRYGLTVGAGYDISTNLKADIGYSAVFFHNRHITNTVGLDSTGFTGADISGTYKDFVNITALNLTYKF